VRNCLLDHIVGNNGVRPNPEKTAAVKNFSVPRKAKTIKQFLDLAVTAILYPTFRD